MATVAYSSVFPRTPAGRLWAWWVLTTAAGLLLSFVFLGLPPFMGLLAGLGQWLVLRQYLRGCGRWVWWVPATAIGATLGWLAAVRLDVPLAGFGLALGLVVGLAQWSVLWRRLRQPFWWAWWLPASAAAWWAGHLLLIGMQSALYRRQAEAFLAGQLPRSGLNYAYFAALAAMGFVVGGGTGAALIWLHRRQP